MQRPVQLTQREFTVLQIRRWAEAGRLRAVVDACDAPGVWHRARDVGERGAVSLYKGRAEEDLAAIAPYLFDVDELTYEWITSTLWPTPWGFFVLSDEPLEALRQHYRKFLVAETPEGDQWYFRFYDPRVLEAYLPTCTSSELADFFGPARAVGFTNPATYGVTVMMRPEAASGVERAQPVVVRSV
ncbi:MAG: DUF4123 domain-containing protein [Gemmatimonadota bacterium]